MIGDGGVLRGVVLVTTADGRLDMVSAEKAETKALVLRALVAAAGGVALLGAGVELANDAIAKARAEVERSEAPGTGRPRRAPALAKTARQAFAAWAGPVHGRSDVSTNQAFPMPPATGVPNADAACDAVMAACSAAGSYAKGDLRDARRLAGNACRFATAASGGTVDWTLAEMAREAYELEVEVEIAGRLFAIVARCFQNEADVSVEFVSLAEAPPTPGEATPYGLAVEVAEPERSELLVEHAAVFREAALDQLQAEAEKADERRANR